MENEELKDLIEINSKLDVVSVVNVWSNGKIIRRWAGQGKDSKWHSPEDGYRKMRAVLVEEYEIGDE